MTRANIGDFLGLTIETVSRTFTKLKQQGVIELALSNQLQLLDVEESARLAYMANTNVLAQPGAGGSMPIKADMLETR